MDFTCCDLEPAVLARNILLLTMIVDGIAIDVAWSIFYHFLLDEPSHDTLLTHCRILIESSSDMPTWKASKYDNPFPVAYNDNQINILNVHYINLDILPSLSLPWDEDDLEWIEAHVGTMFSDIEKES